MPQPQQLPSRNIKKYGANKLNLEEFSEEIWSVSCGKKGWEGVDWVTRSTLRWDVDVGWNLLSPNLRFTKGWILRPPEKKICQMIHLESVLSTLANKSNARRVINNIVHGQQQQQFDLLPRPAPRPTFTTHSTSSTLWRINSIWYSKLLPPLLLSHKSQEIASSRLHDKRILMNVKPW